MKRYFEKHLTPQIKSHSNAEELLLWLSIGQLEHGFQIETLIDFGKTYARLNLPVPTHYYFSEFYQI